jgi:hypothetical protein
MLFQRANLDSLLFLTETMTNKQVNAKKALLTYFTQPPVLFPLVGVFHILWFLLCLQSALFDRGLATLVAFVWMLLYAVGWFGVSIRRKWGSFIYIPVTLVDILLRHVVFDSLHVSLPGVSSFELASPLYLIDVVFSIIILIYYKRLG